MPLLRVEHAKSSRSRCVLKECNKFILKGELRIGTAVMMPGVDEPSFKWRHLCCFTARQAKNAGSVDSVDGYDDLDETARTLVRRTLKGELVGMSSLIGQGATDAPGGATDSPKKAKKAKPAATGFVMPTSPLPAAGAPSGGEWGAPGTEVTAKKKRPRDEPESLIKDDGTWEIDVDAIEVTAGELLRPECPYGDKCFRKNPSHFVEYRHPHKAGDAEGSKGPSTSELKIVAKRKAVADPVPVAKPTVLAPVAKPPIVAPAPPPQAATNGSGTVCPFGAMCFRRHEAKHAAEMSH